MSNTFFTSDTHFSHTNVIKHSGRPFASIEEMDAALIINWNALVQKGDNVFHLGDFAWRDAEKYRDQLNGNIHLIIGNHEKAAEKIKHRFIWVKDVHMVKVGDRRIWLSHYAHRTWPKMHHGAWHLYGHSHGSLEDAGNLSADVGIDAVALRAAIHSRNESWPNEAARALIGIKRRPEAYRPMHLSEVETLFADRSFVPVDHHGEGCGP